MVRLTWIETALVAGGVIITAIGAATLVKAKLPTITPVPPTPEIPAPPVPTPTIPVSIDFTSYPTSLTQLYGFDHIADAYGCQTLLSGPLESFAGPRPLPMRLVVAHATVRVIDAAGHGVPNVAVLIWSVPTCDDQSGILTINDAQRSEAEALRLITDARGEIEVWLIYELKNIKMLEDKLDFGVCTAASLGAMIRHIDVGESTQLPPPLAWICVVHHEGRTEPRVYTVNARIEGTARATLFALSCQTIGRALW